jgi:hypothetical protein
MFHKQVVRLLSQLKVIAIFIPGWWFGTFGLFFHILGLIIPTDFHIFQKGRYTTNQIPTVQQTPFAPTDHPTD